MTTRKISAFVILMIGFGGGLLILNSGHSQTEKPLIAISAADEKNGLSPNFKYSLSKTSSANTSKDSFLAAEETDNLTDLLIRSIAEGITKENPNGPQTINGQTGLRTLNNNSIQSILEEKMADGLTFQRFEEKDLRISQNNSRENQLAYLGELDAIARKRFSGFNKKITDIINEWLNKKNSHPLTQYTETIPVVINDLLSLETPSLWKEFHLQNLNLWQKKLTVYRALLDKEEDPLKTILATQEITNLIEENQNLQAVLENRFDALNS